MNKLWPRAALLVLSCVFTVSPSTADQSVTSMISTNESACWDKCKTCESKCKGKQTCQKKCWATNNTCCKGAGGKGVYQMCGCATDKRRK